MKNLLSIMIAFFSLGALVAIRLPQKIPSKGLRSILILLGAFAAFAVAARSLYEQSNGFEKPFSHAQHSSRLNETLRTFNAIEMSDMRRSVNPLVTASD